MTEAPQYIHIALIGTVSAGKTTLLNALYAARCGNMAIKRTTAAEIVYVSSCIPIEPTAVIFDRVADINREIMDKTAAGRELKVADVPRLEFRIPPVYRLLDGKLKPGVDLAIHDLPGLNDSQTKETYSQYVQEHFCDYDIILFVIDVMVGLNTRDEADILGQIIAGIKANKQKHDIVTDLIVVINKCDEMHVVNATSHEFAPIDGEIKDMADQVRTIVTATIAKEMPGLKPQFVCLSGEDAYIYRMLARDREFEIDVKHRNKFGINECGKSKWGKMSEERKKATFRQMMTKDAISSGTEAAGWLYFDTVLSQALTRDRQFLYLRNRLKLEIDAIKPADTNRASIICELKRFAAIRDKLAELCLQYGKDLDVDPYFGQQFRAFEAGYRASNWKYVASAPDKLIDLWPEADVAASEAIHESYEYIARAIFANWIPLSTVQPVMANIAGNVNRYLAKGVRNKSMSFDGLMSLFGRFIPSSGTHRKIAMREMIREVHEYTFATEQTGEDARRMLDYLSGELKYNAPHFAHCIMDNIDGAIKLSAYAIKGSIYVWHLLDVFNDYYVPTHCVLNDFDKAQVPNIATRLRRFKYDIQSRGDLGRRVSPQVYTLLVRCLDLLSEAYPRHFINLRQHHGVPPATMHAEAYYAIPNA